MTSQKRTVLSKVSAHVVALLSDKGREIPNPIPHSPNVSNKRIVTERDRIRDIIRGEKLKAEMEASGNETFEEADDFEVGEDYDPSSPYEEIFDPAAAEDARRKPTPTKPDAEKDDVVDDTNKPRKEMAVVDDKTYSGSQFLELVSFIRGAPRDVIDKLFAKPDK